MCIIIQYVLQIVPECDTSVLALICTKERLSLPYNWQMACDFEWFPLVARRVARQDKVCMASALKHPYILTAMKIHDQPSSKHLVPLQLHLHTLAARAADPPITLTSR